jgi:hypothetical protein
MCLAGEPLAACGDAAAGSDGVCDPALCCADGAACTGAAFFRSEPPDAGETVGAAASISGTAGYCRAWTGATAACGAGAAAAVSAGAIEMPDVGAMDTAGFPAAGSGDDTAVCPAAGKMPPGSEMRRALSPDAACKPAGTAATVSASFSSAAKSAP